MKIIQDGKREGGIRMYKYIIIIIIILMISEKNDWAQMLSSAVFKAAESQAMCLFDSIFTS